MSNIATKLAYLNGTKQAIKQAINEDFEVIDDNTTFREYADEISSNNAKYKDLIPKETKNATNTLDISNSSGLDKALVTQYGNTYQETTTGKNLANYNDNINNSVPNLTITTDSDGYIIVNGTKNVGYPVIVNQVEITDILEDGETYTLWQEDITPSGTSGFSKCENRIRAINTQGQYSNVRTLGRHTNRLVVDKTTFLRYFVDVVLPNNAETYNNYKNRFMLLKGSYNDSDLIEYEKYTGGNPAPNPDYPQEIVNISGKSNVKVIGKNLFDGILELGNFNSNTGEKVANNNYIINTNPIPVEELTNYKISSNGTGIRMYVFEYKEDMTYNLSTRKTVNDNEYLTTNSGTKYINFRTIDAITDTTSKIQVKKETTASTYEAYKEQSFDLDLKSKNLFDEQTAKTKGSYNANATLMTIQLQPNTQYTFSRIVNTTFARDNGYYLYFVKNEDTSTRIFDLMHLSMTDPITSGTETITTGASGIIKLIGVYAYPERVQNYFNNVNVQIEEGSTATDYEPYYDINLCKIENYKDRIYPLNGKWYLQKKTNKIILNGSESWTLPQTNTNTLRFNCEQGLINGLDASIIKIISNKFVNGKSPSDNDDYEHIKSAVKGFPNMIAICINKSRLSSQNIDGFKTWLSNNNVTVYYIATPITTEITESNYPTLYNQLNNIKLYEGVNHITMTNESGLDVEFDIEYYKNWKLD